MAEHDRKSLLMKAFGNNKVTNTLRLRKKFSDAKAKAVGTGKEFGSFTEWAKKNHPNVKILGG